MSSAKRTLVRNSASIFTLLFPQFNLLNNFYDLKCCREQLRWDGVPLSYSSSSSPSSYSHFYVGSMYDDIRLHVARSYTSSADSPFSLISSFTLSNHLLLGHPLFLLPCTFITIALFLHSVPLFSSHAHTTSTSFPGLYLWFPPLSLSLLFFHFLSCPAS